MSQVAAPRTANLAQHTPCIQKICNPTPLVICKLSCSLAKACPASGQATAQPLTHQGHHRVPTVSKGHAQPFLHTHSLLCCSHCVPRPCLLLKQLHSRGCQLRVLQNHKM